MADIVSIFNLIEEVVDSDEESEMRRQFVIMAAVVSSCDREARHKIQDYVELVVPIYNFDQFKTFFRLSRVTFEMLCCELTHCPKLARRRLDNGGRSEIHLSTQLMFTLWYLGSQETVRSISDRFNISESTFIVRHREIVDELCGMSERYVRWPSLREYQQVSDKFQAKRGFPNVLGAVDGTHIRIQAPPERGDDYYNRKGYYSVILQAVCREDKRFTDIYVGWPGKVHYARVFRNSPIYHRAPQMMDNLHFLGDGAYPIKSWILTPFRDNGHLSAEQRLYNIHHSGTRIVIEHAFGMLKGRFTRLQFIAVKKNMHLINVIIASTVLHNICLLGEDEMEDFFEDAHAEVIDNQDAPLQNENGGMQKRIDIMRLFN